MTRPAPAPVQITATIVRTTAAAVLIAHPSTGRNVWLPLSEIAMDETRPGLAHITLPLWLAKEKDLLDADRQPSLTDLFRD